MTPPSTLPLPPVYGAIVDALRAANATAGRAVPAVAVVASLRPSDVELVRASQLKATIPPGVTVMRMLVRLWRQGVICSAGVVDRTRHYYAPGVPASGTALPDSRLADRYVLTLLTALVDQRGHAVRSLDVSAEVEAGRVVLPNVDASAARPVVWESLKRLVQRSHVEVLAGYTHGPHRSERWMVPAGYPHDEYAPPAALLSFSAAVRGAIRHLWAERVRGAAGAAESAAPAASTAPTTVGTPRPRRPRPLTTREIHAHLVATGCPHADMRRAGSLTRTLQYFARFGDGPVVRRIDRSYSKEHAWAPAGVPDADLDLSPWFTTAAERLSEATRRALVRTGLPAVTAAHIQAEITADPNLTPSAASYPRVGLPTAGLTSAARLWVRTPWHGGIVPELAGSAMCGTGGPGAAMPQPKPPVDLRGRAVRDNTVVKVGGLGKRAYYTVGAQLGPAGLFLRAGALRREWQSLRADEALAGVHACTLPPLAVGRARQLDAELRALDARATALLAEIQDTNWEGGRALGLGAGTHHTPDGETWQDGPARVRALARDCAAQVRAAVNTLTMLSRRSPGRTRAAGLPDAVRLDATGWTVDQFHEFARPLWGVAQRAERPADIRTSLRYSVRRIANPAYVSRRATAAEHNSRYLLERTDVLVYAAVAWGGPVSRYHGQVAHNELGPVRDPRFVLPALASADYEHRLTAVSCLAFLAGDDVLGALRAAATADADPGVRQAALWAYGAAGGADAVALTRARAADDPAAPVRRAAAEMADVAAGRDGGWWVL